MDNLSTLGTDLNIISRLSDTPNITDRLTASDMKAKFDLAGNTIKTFINDDVVAPVNTLVEEVGSLTKNVGTLTTNFDSHATRIDNPHQVTKAQLLLDKVTNNAQYYPGGNDVAIADGGTGASSATGALASLGAAAAVWTSIGSATGTTAITNNNYASYHELLVVINIPCHTDDSINNRKCSVVIPRAEISTTATEWGVAENSWSGSSGSYIAGVYALFKVTQASINLREAYGYSTDYTSTSTIHIYAR